MHSYKTQSFALILVLLSSYFVIAQNKKTPDYLVLNSGDTLYGKVQYIKEGGFGGRKFYKKIRISNNKGKRKKIKQKNIAAFKIDNFVYESYWLYQNSKVSLTLPQINTRYNIDTKKGEQYFLKLISKGHLSHYKLEWFEQGESTLWSASLLKKEKDKFFIRADQGLFGLKRNALLNYFSKCANIREAIKQKTLKDVSQIVEFYNFNCRKLYN